MGFKFVVESKLVKEKRFLDVVCDYILSFLEEPGATIVVFAKLRMLVQDHIPSLLRIRVLGKELVKLQHIARIILVLVSRIMECLPQFIKRTKGLKLLILKDTDTF